MAQSFSIHRTIPPRRVDGRIPVLVTGASGNIGRYFAEHAAAKFALRLMVHKMDERAEDLKESGEVITADLASPDALRHACEGMDTVIHMAANPSPEATWDELLQPNIIGAFNMLTSAKAAGCRRVICASSIHAVSGHPEDVQVKTTDPVNPGDMYGVTKCFGEALGRYMAEQEGLSVIALRIGAFQPLEAAENPDSTAMLDAWVSQRDMQQLLEKCVLDERLRFAIFNALSDNRFKRLDISDARDLLDYRPQDDLTDLNPILKKLHLSEKVSSHSKADERK